MWGKIFGTSLMFDVVVGYSGLVGRLRMLDLNTASDF